MCKKIPQPEAKFYQRQDFKELEEQWYGKLEADGFKDVEKEVGGIKILAQRSCYAYHHTGGKDCELQAAYYRLLSECLHDDLFESELDRIILSRLAEGAKITAISRELKQLGKRWHRQTIRFRIRKYEHKLGIRSWEQHQLNPPWKNGKKKVPIAS